MTALVFKGLKRHIGESLYFETALVFKRLKRHIGESLYLYLYIYIYNGEKTRSVGDKV